MSAVAEIDIGTLAASLEEAVLEDVVSRHRRERKELQAKIQELKKNAPKSDKKKRKEALEEIARLESELELRQAAELKSAEKLEKMLKVEKTAATQAADEPVSTVSSAVSADHMENDIAGNAPQRVSKAQKRRDKKEREARERDEIIRAAEAEDMEFAPKAIETRNMKTKLKARELGIYQIPSDGDCLYNAVRHQLQHCGLGNVNVQELRNETANYILANKDALICYMTHPQTGELLNDEQFEKYCLAVRTTHAWGGQIELKALSTILKVPIEVLQAEGPPTVHGSDEFPGPNLTITYHRHMYRLGEHYNGTLPLSELPPDAPENCEEFI